MKLLGKYFLILILPLYFATRLFNLLAIPIFTDEAIYTYWAQVALHDPANRFISLEDGKQPLFIWIAAVFQKFINDPLIATRLVSVFAGLGSLVGIYLLTKILFDSKIAKLASVLYIILPFTLLYDRMALYDSLLTMFGIFAVYFTIKMAQEPRLDIAILNGFAIGLGMITKSSANFFLYLLPFSLLLFDFKKNKLSPRLTKWFSLTLLTSIFSITIYNLLRLSPLFYLINRKNQEFIRSISEVLASPFLHFVGNFKTIIIWLSTYNTPFLIIIALLVMIFGLLKRQKAIILLSLYIMAPFAAETLFNKVIYPRFALFYFPYIIILISYATIKVSNVRKNYAKYIWIIFTAIILFLAVSSFRLLTDPTEARIADSDRSQYLNSWPAGYGVREVVEILKSQSKDKKVVVGTEGTFGLLPFALNIYFYGNSNIQITGYWPVRDIPDQILESAKTQKTYFVFNENQNLPDDPGNSHLKLIGKYQKGSGESFMRLYEIIPK